MKTQTFKKIVAVAVLSCAAMTAFAEDAPVYDVDSYPPQMDGQNPTGDQAPPPGQIPDLRDQAGNSPDMSSPPDQQAPGSEVPMAQENSAMVSSNIPTYVPPPANLTVDQRVARLEQQLSNAMHSDSFTKFNEMQAQIQTLRGQVEELTHELQTLQKQQKAMYSDLEKRVNHTPTISPDNYEETGDAKPKASATKPAADAAATTAAQPNSAEEQQIYQQAYSLIKAKKYTEAAATFEKMLKKYPSGQFAANAHYWLGELYGLMGNNEKALTEFETVVKNYPENPKVADSQLKLGLIYSSQQKWSDAKSAFKKVVTKFPGTSFARLATEQLKQIKSAGH